MISRIVSVLNVAAGLYSFYLAIAMRSSWPLGWTLVAVSNIAYDRRVRQLS